MSLGYIALVGIFLGLIGLCFAFALSELAHPKDPGPLPIDVRRDIQHRHFARLLRRSPAPAREIVPFEPSRERHFAPQMMEHGAVVGGDSPEAFVVRGDGSVLPGARVESFVCEGVATIGAAATVAQHAEGVEELVVDIAASIGGRATSAARIVLAPDAEVRFAAAPVIRTSGGPVPIEPDPLGPWDPSLDADLEWLLSGGTPLDRAIRDLQSGSGRSLNGVAALRHAEAGSLRAPGALPLKRGLKPTWAGAARVWYLGAGTVRVRGDVILPPGALVPFHLIVEGKLAAGRAVRFHGGIHAWGGVALGEDCRVEGSLTSRRSVTIADGSSVGECVSAGGDATIGSAVRIGSEHNGGLAALGKIVLGPGTVIRNKLFAEEGARVRSLVPTFVPVTL